MKLELHEKATLNQLANSLRILSMDMVEKARSGHPGLPLGMADVVTVLYKYFLVFNPKDPSWINRDRFLLSAGHGSALLYSLLYLNGYEKNTLDELKNFRQLNSKTNGHPEYDQSAGIETTTGPLGQGIANAVGMAIAAKMMAARFDYIRDYKIYVLVSDGCLMEGITHEAISIAGHLKLDNLVVIFDDNGISIDGPTNLATSENHLERFKACGFNTNAIDGHNYDEIHQALTIAQSSDKPSLIACKTTIGFGASKKAGTADAHGSPLGKEEAAQVRTNLNWQHPPFIIPEEIINEWSYAAYRCNQDYLNWSQNKSPDVPKIDLSHLLSQKQQWSQMDFIEASRKSSEFCINFICDLMPNMVGGSADLTCSNYTKASNQKAITRENFKGSYLHWGIREHAMAAIMNGIALDKYFIPYGGTFLVFSDYLRPALRLSAIMNLRVIYIMTHDSIGVGEDGPTHQPVEHLATLRAIPNLLVMRPYDRVETLECWQIAIEHEGPSLIALSRQQFASSSKEFTEDNNCVKGIYPICHYGDNNTKPAITIYATGSEVALAKTLAAHLYEQHGISVVLLSAVCLELFELQPKEYKDKITNNDSLKIVIEAGCKQGWEGLLGNNGLFFGVEYFGRSAPAEQLYEYFGLTVENMATKILLHLSHK